MEKTHLSKRQKESLKTFAKGKVISRFYLSDTGQEWLEMQTNLAVRLAVELRETYYPLRDMQVLNKYDLHGFCGILHHESLMIPLLSHKYILTCVQRGTPNYNYSECKPYLQDMVRYLDVDFQKTANDIVTGKISQINEQGLDWKVKRRNQLQVEDLESFHRGLILPDQMLTRHSQNLFFRWQGPSLGAFNFFNVSGISFEPETAAMLKIQHAMFASIQSELKRSCCAFDFIIEKKRYLEDLAAVWPEVTEYMALPPEKTDGCQNMTMKDAEALIQQDMTA